MSRVIKFIYYKLKDDVFRTQFFMDYCSLIENEVYNLPGFVSVFQLEKGDGFVNIALWESLELLNIAQDIYAVGQRAQNILQYIQSKSINVQMYDVDSLYTIL
jgi:hypothetical protein